MNLQPYFSRIGYSGPTHPTLNTLDGILFHHVTSVPFENVSVLLGQPICIDVPAIENKIIGQRRGGYCFEQNTLLLHVLTTLGFQATVLSGRVRIKATRDFVPPRTHMFLKVTIGGQHYLADVGVGGLSPSYAIPLDPSADHVTLHEPRRIVQENGRFYHQVRVSVADAGATEWSDVVEFTGEEMPLIDRELANYWTSTHPQSKFRQNLMVALACKDGTRMSLLNNDLTHRKGPQVLSMRALKTPDEIRETLANTFNLILPAASTLQAPNLTYGRD